MENFKIFYDSNAVFGNVESLEELKDNADIQVDSGGLETLDGFLDKSLETYPHGSLNFGTRREHEGRSLREFLSEEKLLDEFISLF